MTTDLNICAVGYEEESLADKARLLAEQLNFTVDKDASPCLFFTAEKLAVKIPGFSLISAEFTMAAWKKRKAAGKKQGLVRACKPGFGVKIIDATAGWGRDAAVLASLGAEVLMLERHPVMACLLADALQRRGEQDRQHLQLSLHVGDAYAFLSHLEEGDYPDLIYLDPMHPQRDKSALVKKDMQVLQQLIGSDTELLALISLALSRVKQKVLVKWPQKTKALLPPQASIPGKKVRFDVYLP